MNSNIILGLFIILLVVVINGVEVYRTWKRNRIIHRNVRIWLLQSGVFNSKFVRKQAD